VNTVPETSRFYTISDLKMERGAHIKTNMHACIPQISGPRNAPRRLDTNLESCPTISTILANGDAYQSRGKRRTDAQMQVQSILLRFDTDGQPEKPTGKQVRPGKGLQMIHAIVSA
jgi:hypothetical protein